MSVTDELSNHVEDLVGDPAWSTQTPAEHRETRAQVDYSRSKDQVNVDEALGPEEYEESSSSQNSYDFAPSQDGYNTDSTVSGYGSLPERSQTKRTRKRKIGDTETRADIERR